MTEWYRNTDWNDEIEVAFFEKLARTRSQRDQYIVLQAHHLADSHPKITLRLIDFYFETRTDDFDEGRARRAESAAHFALGGYKSALDDYQQLLDGEGERDLYVGSPLQFAFLAARYRSESHYEAALTHLSHMSQPDEKSPELRFRFLTALAFLLSETGRDPAGAVRAARAAIGAPQVVLDLYPDVVWRLRGITRT